MPDERRQLAQLRSQRNVERRERKKADAEADRLRAENKQQYEDHARAIDAMAKNLATAERNEQKARKEIASLEIGLSDLTKEADQARAERDEARYQVDAWRSERELAEAELRRLRAALREIAKPGAGVGDTLREIARTALADRSEDG